MIAESKPWKDELLANARTLMRCTHSKRRSERRSLAVERAIFISAYIMRKLWEAEKLSSSWKDRKVRCTIHALKDQAPDFLNWHRIEEHYDLGASKSDWLTAIEFCHRLIHSYVFVECEARNKTVRGVFFASDQTKNRGLWFVKISDVVKLLQQTGRDYPASAEWVRHPSK
jgi:hypothetical protein